jgi:hypothetical protein
VVVFLSAFTPAAAAAATYSISSGSTTPTSAAPGQTVTIKANFSLSVAGTVQTYFEIRNSSNTVLTTKWYYSQVFAAGKVRSYTWSLPVPSKYTAGTYRVNASIFKTDRSNLLKSVTGITSFRVTTTAPTSTPTTTPTPTPAPPPTTTGRQFYVDNISGSDSSSGTSSTAPWKSLAKVNGATFQAGDVINFKRGSVWTGTLTVSRSGASGKPITFRDYGSGNAPVIQRATAPGSSGLTRTVVITGSWIVFQNFRITNAHEAGIFLGTAANHNVIRNNEITATGYGAAVYGQFNLLTQNYVHDLHIIVNDAAGGNYGAGCFFFQQAGSGGNEVSYNRGINCRARDAFFNFNGKFVEVYNNGDNLYIHHNYAENPQGFFEAGAGGGSRTARNIRFVYNVLVNSHADAAQPCGAFWFNTTGSYAITTSNFVFDNNTVYQRTGDGGVWRLFASNADLSFLTVRNNIFHIDTQIANTGSFRHTNNVYYMANMVSGSGVGYSLGTGEQNANPLFVNVSGRDFRLQLTSPAIDAGIDLGYKTDFNGSAVPLAVSSLLPDIGAYEFKR